MNRKELKKTAFEIFSKNGHDYGTLQMQFIFKAIDMLYYGEQIEEKYRNIGNCSVLGSSYHLKNHLENKFLQTAQELNILRLKMSDEYAQMVSMFLRMNVDFSSWNQRLVMEYERRMFEGRYPYATNEHSNYFRHLNKRVHIREHIRRQRIREQLR